MSAMSDFLEANLVNHLFRGVTYNPPTTLALALATAVLVDGNTGSLGGNEVANTGAYARQALNPSATNWADPSTTGGATGNSATVTYPTATANWGTVTDVAILDSATWGVGNLLFYGVLGTSKTVNNGDTFKFNLRGLTVTLA